MFAGPTRLEALFGAGDLQCGQQALSFKARSWTTSKAAGVTARKRNNGGQTIAPPSKKRKLLAANMAARSLCLEASTKLAMAKRIGGVTLSPKIQKSKDKRSSESQEMELVGSVKESVAAHKIRHPDHVSDCARCKWIRWGAGWKEKQGSYRNPQGGQAQRIEWVSERAVCRGGAWALGCTVCSHAQQKLKGESALEARKIHGRLDSKWARFEIRCKTLQADSLAQHANMSAHRMAMEIYLCPETPVSELLTVERTVEDQNLLQGSVPHPPDWLRAWRHLKEGVSFRSSTRLQTTEKFIEKGVAQGLECRKVKALQSIIVERKREQKRNWLRAASSIAIVVDDRGAWKLLRFRCDHGRSFKAGVLRVLYRGGVALVPVEEWNDDFCQREAESIMRGIRDFCTGREYGFDTGLFEHMRVAIHIYVSDGCAAALKTGRMLKTSQLQNIAFMIRDPAHAIRIAARDPLHAEERFGEFWTRVFDSKHALVRDIQHSDQIRAKLESCQARVREVMGSQGGGLQSILKHLSAAKQRFESFASPARRYCLLLNSLALLLALIATDVRKDKATREAAEQALEAITPDSIVVSGLTADYTAECLDFVRKFDRSNVDPATIVRKRETFKQRMIALFLQGFAAMEPPNEDAQDRTMLQIVMAQVADMPVFHYNDKRHMLWSSGAAAQVKSSCARMATVVSDLLQRLDAELSDNDMVCKFQVFDLLDWSDSGLSQARKCHLEKHLRSLTRALNKSATKACAEFSKVLPAALAARELRISRLTASGVTEANEESVDNRDCWGDVLESPHMNSCDVMPLVIRLYQAVPLGTPDVERNLGAVTALLHEHSGANSSETVTMLLEGLLELDENEDDLFIPNAVSSQVLLELTETSRAWQQMWIRMYGRRFGGYSKTRAPAHKPKKVGSEARIQQQRRAAVQTLVKRALTPNADLHAKCFGGLVRRDLSGDALAKAIKQLPQTKKQQQFRQRTRTILDHRQKEASLRRLGNGKTWCVKPKVRIGCSAETNVEALPARVIAVPMRTSTSFQIESSALVSVRPSMFSAVRAAHVIFVSDLKLLERCDTWHDAVLLIYAVGLGKIVIGEKDWHGTRPWTGARAIRYQPQAKASPMTLVAGSHLQNHGNVIQALRDCSEDAKWLLVTQRPAHPGSQQVVFLDDLFSVRQFLFKHRRIVRHKDAKGKFQK